MEGELLSVHRTTTVWSTLPLTHLSKSNCSECRNYIKAVGWVQLTFATISLLASFSMIGYLVYRRICGTREVRPLFHLVCADAGLALFLILSATVWSYQCCTTCEYFQIFAEMFYLITFLLTANYALNVYIRMKDRYHRANNLVLLRESKYHNWFLVIGYLFCWIAPFASVLPALIMNKNHSSDTCYSLFFDVTNQVVTPDKFWLDQFTSLCLSANVCFHGVSSPPSTPSDKYGTILFLTTLFSSLLAIIIFYSLTTRVYQKLLRQQNEFTDRQRHSVRGLQRRVTLYIGVFLFCWTPASILAFFDLYNGGPDIENLPFLYILQSMTAPSQGLLNSIVYGWTRRSVYFSNQPTDALNRQTFRGYGSSATKRIYPQKPEPSRPVSEESAPLDEYKL